MLQRRCLRSRTRLVGRVPRLRWCRSFATDAALPPPKQLPQRRVVVTGLGMVTPLGVGVERNWQRLLAGESGVDFLPSSLVSQLTKVPVRIGAWIKRGNGPDEFDATKYLSPEELHVMPPFIQYSVVSAMEALRDANWHPETPEDQCRTGTAIGSGIGGIDEIEKTSIIYSTEGYRKVSPYYIPRILINLPAGHISIKFRLKGPNHSVSTACATGVHSIGDAFHMIKRGDADVMVAGATESCITPTSIAGFARCRALSTNFNDRPKEASRPFDKNRDGFVMGEGAGAIVLEELEHAKARGARIYAEVRGYGLSADAHHITAPAEDGSGAYRCMESALNSAGLTPDLVDYINAHATSTPLGDRVETMAIKRLFQNHAKKLAVSSTKGATGHLIAAAGTVESIFTILSIVHNVAPPTINLTCSDDDMDLNFVPNRPQPMRIRVALCNAFGFGGTNASIVFTEPPV